MEKINYPIPGKKAEFIKALNEFVEKGVMAQNELDYCLILGGISDEILNKINARMVLSHAQYQKNKQSRNYKSLK